MPLDNEVSPVCIESSLLFVAQDTGGFDREIVQLFLWMTPNNVTSLNKLTEFFSQTLRFGFKT